MARTRKQDRERQRARRQAFYAAGLTATGFPRSRAPKRGTLIWYLWQLALLGYPLRSFIRR